ncbi:MAG TPA: histone deacetylase family protein [Burkholderiaceae bacterium]|jgi:acetoin utilization deacetylase AcuC-like enzyme
MPTAFITHPDCHRHDMGQGHPECPQRLAAIEDWLLATGIDLAVQRVEARKATREELTHGHQEAYVDRLTDSLLYCEALNERRALDADTVAGPGTHDAVMRAAGAAVQATDMVIDGEASNAFCATRPPGHHATSGQAMGFCFFNNVAVAARHALDVRGLARVAIIDFDVHHGNGTEDIIANDERVLMVSFFQHPLYPGTGTEPLGDNMINLPVAPYTRGPEVRALIEQHWMPALEAFRPEMIFISAGFDAHREDDLGQMGLVEADYTWMTERIKQVADRHAKGRIVSCLEGGYALDALARSVGAHLKVLAGI